MTTVNSGYDRAFAKAQGQAYRAPSYNAATSPFGVQPQQSATMPISGYQTPPQYVKPAGWETAEFGGNPLYGNYKQATPVGDSRPSDAGYINGTDAARFKKSGLPFDVWLAERNRPKQVNQPGGLNVNQALVDARIKQQEAEDLKKKLASQPAASTAPAPVFGNTRQKEVGYWGIRGY